ncbi:MAG: TldD/PmbA family protein [Betaproteobacteria bacterium]|nr:TldD/PmbA family protein [Betaproteobacteria bacterium]
MLDTIRQHFGTLRCDAAYWSLRFVDERSRYVCVRQDVAEAPSLDRDSGAMLTVFDGGGYGYAATADLSAAGLQAALDRAHDWARATTRHSVLPADAAPPHPRGRRVSPGAGESLPTARELLDLALAESAAAGFDDRIVDWQASIEVREADHLLLTNRGGDVHQQYRFMVPDVSATAHANGDTQTRSLSGRGFCRQGGRKVLADAQFAGAGRRLAEEALALVGAPNCPTGRMDVLLMPDQMMLQIHESIGHPLELDRILGDERNYAGTSFVTLDMFGSYRYGSELLNVSFDPTPAEEYGSYAFDDEGAAARKTLLIERGILQRPLGGELSQRRAGTPGVANTRACSWNRPPIDRMANLNVEPGASSLAGMIAGIERGVMLKTNLSWSIDDSRNKFQFGCEWGQLIENGKLTAVVKNPNYRGVSATFWRSLKAVGDQDTFDMLGTPTCGKGEPNQAIGVGHASPACVFAGVDVFGGEE